MQAPPNDEWLSAAEIARRRGLDRSTTSRRISRFVEQRLLEVRDGPGGARRYNLDAFDKVSAENVDPARSLAAGQRQPKPAAARDVDIGDAVVLLDEVTLATAAFLNAVMAAIDLLPAQADKIAASASPEDAHAAIRQVHTDMRAAVKEAADCASVRTYSLTPKGRRGLRPSPHSS